MAGFFRQLRAFRQAEDGVISIEFVLMVPILIWALLATLVYFDLYRSEAISTRAALTITDMYSRERDSITPDYVDNSRELLRIFSENDASPDMRVSVFWYDADEDKLDVAWSESRDFGPALTDDELATMRSRIPVMAGGDRAILLETRIGYQAPFVAALGPFVPHNLNDVAFETFTVVRPRFLIRLCFDDKPNNPNNAELCE